MKRQSLSILIPAFNGDCYAMVEELCRQASNVSGLDYEVIVADDGSTDRTKAEACSRVELLPCCRFIGRETNVGRAAIRNFLAQEAEKDWLLFIDCDMLPVSEHFITTYLEAEGDVIYGGYSVGPGLRSNLRYRYEKACEHEHTAQERRKRPYQHFHTSNFMVSRSVMKAIPFDERFRHYGYEDVFFGKQLRQAGITINHIDNPMGFNIFEDNAHFIAKTEESLRTLHQFRNELRGYSRMLVMTEGIHLSIVRGMLRLWHRMMGAVEHRWLCGKHPSLRLFSLYKLGYFLTLKD